jgi:hypothetical protein
MLAKALPDRLRQTDRLRKQKQAHEFAHRALEKKICNAQARQAENVIARIHIAGWRYGPQSRTT